MVDSSASHPQASASGDADSEGASAATVSNLGYRPWSGRKVAGWTRWTVITAVGVRRAWQSHWLRRMLLFAWLPAIWFGLGFFIWEQATLYPEWRAGLAQLLRRMPPSTEMDAVRDAVRNGDLAASRHTVWAGLLQSFFRYPQGVLMVMVVGLIAPPLISQDIRSRAFLLYFSRPLTRGEYLLGKLGCLWAYLALISTIPALALYVVGLLVSPNLEVFFSTWDVPLRVVAASLVLMVPTSFLALALSSLTQESRYAGFAWFAIWILGWFTYAAVNSAEAIGQPPDPFGELQRSPEPSEPSPWTHLSLYHTLGRVQHWVFGFASFSDVIPSLIILGGVTLISLAIILRRISAPMRA